MSHVRCVLLFLGACLALPGAALADTPVGSSAKGTAIAAGSGYAVWRADDGRLVVRAGGGGARTTSLKPPASAIFDVGAKRGGGGAQVAWASDCSTRAGTCVLRSAVLRGSGTLRESVVTHIAYRGGGSPAVAVEGSRLAYTLRDGRCDVPYVRTLGHGSRRMDRGHCADISQLDVTSKYVGVLAHPGVTYGTGATEARVVRMSGGRSRTLQREAQGEESNSIGSIAFDDEDLYTARAGIRQPNVFTRWSVTTGSKLQARAFVDLNGAMARTRGRMYYLQNETFTGAEECPCVVVAGDDPFAPGGRRTLIPALSLAVTPQPVFVDSDPSAQARLTRQTVTRTALAGGPAPVPGVTVELLAVAANGGQSEPIPVPTGATAVTDASGLARIRIPEAPRPRVYLEATTRPGGGGVPIPTNDLTYVQTFVHLTANATRLADGRLQVTGTIAPAQPGRKVRLDRKLDRICNQGAGSSGTSAQPNQAGVPAGCFDRYTQDPVATAAVSPDGSTYTLVAPSSSPAGTYSVSLDSPRAVVYAGQTEGFPAL